MKTSETPPLGQTGNPPETDFYTPYSRRTRTLKRLIVTPGGPITSAKYDQHGLHFPNGSCDPITLSPKDPHQPPDIPAQDDEPIPKGSVPDYVNLSYILCGLTQPHTAQIQPPHTLITPYPADTAFLRRLLKDSHILTVKKVAEILLILATTAASLLPDLNPDETDDTEQFHLHAHALASST